jgi:hypothetical protein
MIKQIKKFFGFNPQNVWVRNNVFTYGLQCKRMSGGSFYISRGKTTCYFNGTIESKLEQLKTRAKAMGFEKGFWFLKSKAKELNYNFHYERMV